MTMTTDLALAADAGFLDRCEDPGAFISRACDQARALLRKALENGDIDQVAEIRSQAEAVLRACSPQDRLGKGARLAATEFLRRAERALGLAIRQGQAAGTIRGPHNGRQLPKPGTAPMRQVGEFATVHELAGGGQRDGSQIGIYALTDGISDEDFEAALTRARAEGNLFRSNVARKARARTEDSPGRDGDGEWIPSPDDHGPGAPAQRRKLIRIWAGQGFTSHQIGEQLGILDDTIRRLAREGGVTIGADDSVRRTRRHDSTRITRETVHALEGLAMGTELVAVSDVSPAEAKDWATSLTASLRILNRFARQIKEIVPSD